MKPLTTDKKSNTNLGTAAATGIGAAAVLKSLKKKVKKPKFSSNNELSEFKKENVIIGSISNTVPKDTTATKETEDKKTKKTKKKKLVGGNAMMDAVTNTVNNKDMLYQK